MQEWVGGGGEGEERIVGRRGGGEERRGWGVLFDSSQALLYVYTFTI